MQCKSCGTSMPEGKLRCTKCHAWNVVQDDSLSKSKVIPGADPDGTIILRKVTSADANRIDIGEWNPLWGGGIVTTSTTLFGGDPGAGKSTALLQICKLILKACPTKEVMIVAAEEHQCEVKLRADRIGLQDIDDKIRIVPAMKGVTNLSELFVKYKPGMIILDSLQALAMDDQSAQLQICKICKEFSTDLECPIIIISHVNKSGDLSGINDLQHEVDTTLLLTIGDAEIRTCTVKKNRFGPNAAIHFDMTETGLVPINIDEEIEESEKQEKTSKKLEKIASEEFDDEDENEDDEIDDDEIL